MAAVFLSIGSFSTAAAQGSSQNTRIVIGFAPGGALDALARNVAERLRVLLDEPVIVENRPGASTRIAIEHVKNSRPDGKTILISPSTPFTLFPLTYKSLPYDAENDFIPVTHLANVPVALATGVNQPYSTAAEYVEWVRQNPQNTGVGMAALGTAVHFGTIALSKAVDLPLVPVAYRGGAAMLTDVVSGTVPVGIDALASMSELYRAQRIRILGVTGTERSALLPDVPTLKESGAPGYEFATAWYAAFVPAGTPSDVVASLEKALLHIAKDKDMYEKILAVGMEMTGYPSAELAEIIEKERSGWKPLVASTDFTPE